MRAGWFIALLCAASVGARRCYVSYGSSRLANATAIATCPEELYGPNPSCGVSCAKHKASGEDLCSFYCMPSRHCSSTGRLRPDFDMAPANFLDGCPKETNYEPAESTELECNAACCQEDMCNTDAAARGARWSFALAVVSLGVSLLTCAVHT